MRKLAKNLDEYGLPMKWEIGFTKGVPYEYMDGGDSACMSGQITVAAILNKGFNGEADVYLTKDEAITACKSMIKHFEVLPEQYARHPDPNQWWSDPKHFSRDQHSSVAIAKSFLKDKESLQEMFERHLKRFGVYQNFQLNSVDVNGKKTLIKGDIASPEHFGIYFRGLDMWYMYPFLLLGDIFTLINSMVITYKSMVNPDDVSNDLNHVLVLLQSKHKYPTIISWLARQLYVSFRKNAGLSKATRLQGFGPQTALDHYYREDLYGTCPINELFKPFLEKELKQNTIGDWYGRIKQNIMQALWSVERSYSSWKISEWKR